MLRDVFLKRNKRESALIKKNDETKSRKVTKKNKHFYNRLRFGL